jgi:hypothetical protein
MRIGYAVVILADLFVRASALTAHYSDAGVFPRWAMFSQGLLPQHLCLHVLNGSTFYLTVLFLIHGLAALALLLGYGTRWATVICCLMAVSLQTRNFALLNGGDVWMRLVLFWAIFLPWGRRWSVDACQAPPQPLQNNVCSVATFAFLQQVFTVYFLAGLFKTSDSWHSTGDAIYLALNMTEWNSEIGILLLYFPGVMKALTLSIYWFEILGPLLLITPIAIGPLRTLAVALFFLFHGGLYLAMELGIFPFVGMATVLGLLPAWAWRQRPLAALERFCDGQAGGGLLSRLARRLPPSGPAPAEAPRLLVSLLLLALTSLSALWNVASYSKGLALPPALQTLGHIVRMDQYWGLFAPSPPKRHGWMVLEGVLSDGSTVDLLRGEGAVRWRKPSSSGVYANHRWKRFYLLCADPKNRLLRQSLANWLCREWAAKSSGPSRLKSVRIYWLSQDTLPNYEDSPPKIVFLGEFLNPLGGRS